MSEEGARYTQELSRWILVHTFVPVALGLRKSGLHHKICGFLHALHLAVGSITEIGNFFDTVVSITTDMGTESGLAAFHSTNCRNLMPAWLVPNEVEFDQDEMPDCRRSVPTDPTRRCIDFSFADVRGVRQGFVIIGALA